MLALKYFGVVTILSLGFTSCGSDGPPATATPGSKFCALALDATKAGQALDVSVSPDELKKQVAEGQRIAKLAAAKAPKDFQDIAKRSNESQDAFVKILEANDYDVVASMTSAEGQKLLKDPDYSGVQDERKTYLKDKCNIQPPDTTEAPALNLGSGDEGIRNLFKLLQVAPGFSITDAQVDCAVDNLSGNLSAEEIQAIASQTDVTDDTNIKLGLAVQACEIVLPGS
jgi:hypothetical protein